MIKKTCPKCDSEMKNESSCCRTVWRCVDKANCGYVEVKVRKKKTI